MLAMTICPIHCTKLGLGWSRGFSTRCRVPEGICNHGKGKGTWPKGEGLQTLPEEILTSNFLETQLLCYFI